MNTGRIRRILLLVVLACIAGGCDTGINEEPPPVLVLLPREVEEGEYTTTESGLQYHDFVIGDGEAADSTHRIIVHYAGWLTDQRLIGTSYLTNAPITVNLGSDTIIDGWNEGIPGMREGGERQLLIPPELGYGEDGFDGAGIPSNATLIYEIELLSIESEESEE